MGGDSMGQMIQSPCDYYHNNCKVCEAHDCPDNPKNFITNNESGSKIAPFQGENPFICAEDFM